MITVLSLGAGVQSSTMALMAERGELGYTVDHAIFADTGAEPRGVYEYLDYIESLVSFPIHRVMHKGGLLEQVLSTDGGARFVTAPFYTLIEGRAGMTRRQCTREFKIQPIQQKVRELLGLSKGQRGGKEVAAQQLIGISLDEMQRMKDSGCTYIENRWPLIEKRMTRQHCLNWMKDNGYRMPAKSACFFCPYTDDNRWREMRDTDPESWNRAVAVDEFLRAGNEAVTRGLGGEFFVHRSCTALKGADLRTAADFGQISFLDECDGICGV